MLQSLLWSYCWSAASAGSILAWSSIELQKLSLMATLEPKELRCWPQLFLLICIYYGSSSACIECDQNECIVAFIDQIWTHACFYWFIRRAVLICHSGLGGLVSSLLHRGHHFPRFHLLALAVPSTSSGLQSTILFELRQSSRHRYCLIHPFGWWTSSSALLA